MEFLFFDEKAISHLVSTKVFQSTEFSQGARFVEHICGNLQSEVLENIVIEYYDKGILFVGGTDDTGLAVDNKDYKDGGIKVFCIDLIQCNLLSEKNEPSNILTVLQKTFRTAMRVWNCQPFTFSERIHGSKSIVFPFVFTDRRRIVIERSNNVPRLTSRGIKFPLLAYKYNAEDAPQNEEVANTDVLRDAGELYVQKYRELQRKAHTEIAISVEDTSAMKQITATTSVRGAGFIYMDYEKQFSNLTDAQKFVVEYPDITSPLRVDGAAGTGKTVSLIMRAYHLLNESKNSNRKIHIIFFAHSESTSRRNYEIFTVYENSTQFLDPAAPQNITFTTLFQFCRNFVNITQEELVEKDAGDAKSYQLMLIDDVVEKARTSNKLRTYKALLSKELQEAFDSQATSQNALCSMLQHEFSVQIKGRTDGTIDAYYDIPSIKNGLPCKNKKDKEFVFLLFNDYQDALKYTGSFDVDDVVMEALSHYNGPQK